MSGKTNPLFNKNIPPPPPAINQPASTSQTERTGELENGRTAKEDQGRTVERQNSKALKEYQGKTGELENGRTVERQNSKTVKAIEPDEGEKATIELSLYLRPSQDDKLEDLRREYKRATRKKISANEIMRRLIDVATLEQLLE